MGADSPKSTLETEDYVPKAEDTDPIKSYLIRDDLHMRAHLRSERHLLTPALKEINRQEQSISSKNGHENILFTDEKIFIIVKQYNNQ
jgi:hypothetical protein